MSDTKMINLQKIREMKFSSLLKMRTNIKDHFSKVAKQWYSEGHQGDVSTKVLDRAICNEIPKGICLLNVKQGILVLNIFYQDRAKSLLKTLQPGDHELTLLDIVFHYIVEQTIAKKENDNVKITMASYSANASTGAEINIEDPQIDDNALYVSDKKDSDKIRKMTAKDLQSEIVKTINVLKKIAGDKNGSATE